MENISFDEFMKIDLRVALILECEEIPGADKLYALTIDLGDERRQIVAGIKQYYGKEELVGRRIAVVANLEPRKVRGIMSHGMLLAASSPDKSAVVLLSPDREIPAGSKIS